MAHDHDIIPTSHVTHVRLESFVSMFISMWIPTIRGNIHKASKSAGNE